MKTRNLKLARLIVPLLLWICCMCQTMFAQSVAVQIVDGRSGKPIGKGRVVHIAFASASFQTILTLHTNSQGEVQFDAEGAKAFSAGVVGYLPCSDKGVGTLPESYAVSDVLQSGSASSNDCGQLSHRIGAGSLVYFVKREPLASRLEDESNSR
jgi:hypothetical protein